MSTNNIYQAIAGVLKRRQQNTDDEPSKLLDIGAGWGKLIEHLSDNFNLDSSACDYHVENFPSHLNVDVKQVNFNEQLLPYEDNSFDIATSSEVIEHVENYRRLIREIKRVLKPGGVMILTTPNVLNMKSRLRYLSSGFFNLFGPLPVKNDKLYSTGGHITPIPYFF